jgi:hypothetical protein
MAVASIEAVRRSWGCSRTPEKWVRGVRRRERREEREERRAEGRSREERKARENVRSFLAAPQKWIREGRREFRKFFLPSVITGLFQET